MAWTDIANPSGVISTTLFGNLVVANFAVEKNHRHDPGVTGDGGDLWHPRPANDLRIGDFIPLGGVATAGIADSRIIGPAAAAVATWDSTLKKVYYLTASTSGTQEVIVVRETDFTIQLLPRCLWLVAHNALTVNDTLWCGYGSSMSGGNPTDGCFFRAVGNANWFAVNRAGGVETATDTGIAASTTIRGFEVIPTSTTSVTYYIDGVLKATVSTNAPATTTLMRFRLASTVSSSSTRIGPYMGWSHKMQSS